MIARLRAQSSPSPARFAAVLALAAAVFVLLACLGASNPTASAATAVKAASTPSPSVATVSPWKVQAAPMAWAEGRIYYNQKNTAGVFDGWSANPDGSDARCVTCGGAYPAGTQHGVSDVTSDGRYALTTVERTKHWPIPDGTYIAAPGNGAYNDLWLQTSDGSQAWRLSNSITTGAGALIWARFDRTGTRVVWSEQWRWGFPFGAWRMLVADIKWTNGVPSLANKKTFQSTGFLEPYGFTADGSRVLFAADVLAGTSATNLQIMSLSADLTGTAVRLSPNDATGTGNWSNYNEFAFVLPGTDRIIFGRSVGAFYQSLEYWTMNADGSDARQLTTLSLPWSLQYHGYPSLAGGLAFNPDDPRQFVAGFGTNYQGDYKSAVLTLK
jgi:hypothetical protein